MAITSTVAQTITFTNPKVLVIYLNERSKRIAQILYYALEEYIGEGFAFISEKDEAASLSYDNVISTLANGQLRAVLLITLDGERPEQRISEDLAKLQEASNNVTRVGGPIIVRLINFKARERSTRDGLLGIEKDIFSRFPQATREPQTTIHLSEWSAYCVKLLSEFQGGFFTTDTAAEENFGMAGLLIRRATHSKWKKLDLTLCGLHQIPPAVFDLSGLEVLDVSNGSYDETIDNRIAEISDDIGKLASSLIRFYCSGQLFSKNSLTDISALAQLTELTELELDYNNVAEIDALNKLTKLKRLNLFANPIEDISVLKYMKELEELNLGACKVEDIRVLQGLKKLRYSNLRGNKITDISPLLFFVKNKAKISLDTGSRPAPGFEFLLANNPIHTPPIEVIGQGNDAILKYFEQLNKANPLEVSNVNYLKLVLAGNSTVGKTYLSTYLQTGQVPEGDNKSTHVLNIVDWKPDFLQSTKDAETHIKIFDFGGQDYYHDTHNLFYSGNTAYVLMWDTPSNYLQEIYIDGKYNHDNFFIEYWLEAIRSFTKPRETSTLPIANIDNLNITERKDPKLDSPILLLQNKIDISQSRVDQQRLTSRYNNIWGFYDIALKGKKRLGSFNELLEDFFNAISTTGRRLFKYQQFLLEEFQKDREFQILSLTNFHVLCNNLLDKSTYDNQIDLSEAEVIMNIMHNIGFAYSFKIPPAEAQIILNLAQFNQYIQDVMTIAKDNQGRIAIGGDSLTKIPGAIIDLLVHKKSLIRISDNELVAPNFLPLKPDTNIAIMLDAFAPAIIRYKYHSYFHKSIVLEFFNRYINEVESDSPNNLIRYNFWKNGMVLYRESATGQGKEWVLIEFKKELNEERYRASDKTEIDRMRAEYKYDFGQIEIRPITGFKKTPFIEEIEKQFDELNQHWNTIKEVTIDGINYFDVANFLQKKKEEKEHVFVCKGKKYSLSSFKDFIKLEKIPRKVFVSYSSLDRVHLINFINHLISLKREELIEPWDDRQLVPGESWDEAIIEELDKAEIVILLLTVNFLNSTYIWQKELEQALKKGKKIIPIYVDYCTWELEGKINNIQGLKVNLGPTEKVPVLKFPNHHEGWVQVINQIRAIISI
jgi:internalin A